MQALIRHRAPWRDEARRIAANIARLPSDLAEGSMSTLTIYLARLIGLSAVLLVAALLVRGNALIMATVADGPVMLVYAIFSLAAGLAIILGPTTSGPAVSYR